MKEPNIRLRALELEDLDFLYQIENDDRLWELGVSNVPYSRRVLLDYITSASADIYVDNQVRLIVENEQNEQVGILDLTDFDPRHHRAELGIVIKKEFQGQGYAKASVSRLLQYARNVLHLQQIYAIVGIRNQKAAKMLQSVGFEGNNVLKQWLCGQVGYEDAMFFNIFCKKLHKIW